MSPRIKSIVQTPDNGAGECCIGGTYYFPEFDDDGDAVFECTNVEHVTILTKQHGFKVKAQKEIAPAPSNFGLIDYEEMGRSQLARALTERGQLWDKDSGREEMERAAQAWNDVRKGRMEPQRPRPALVAPSADRVLVDDPRLASAPAPAPAPAAADPVGALAVSQAAPAPSPAKAPTSVAPELLAATTDTVMAMPYPALKALAAAGAVAYPHNVTKPALQQLILDAAAAAQAQAA